MILETSRRSCFSSDSGTWEPRWGSHSRYQTGEREGQTMTLNSITRILDPGNLICIEDEDENVYFCCEFGELTIGDLKPIKDRTIKVIYPEAYGKYYLRHGITIVLKNA